MNTARPAVLFLCTENSARSQIAEALLRHYAGSRFEAHSAGLAPREVHPMALRVLTEMGVDASGLYAKPIHKFLGRVKIDYAVVVCEQVEQTCPKLYPFALQRLYWPFDDPAAAEGTEDERLARFRQVRDRIDWRIREWLHEVSGE